jgi:HAD superfamily hydrolase (TIGR01509 family)
MLADLLTTLGHPTSFAEAIEHFTGLSGEDFVRRVEARIGRELPPEFHQATRAERDRTLREGIAAVAGAVEFVRGLPATLPKAVASSSSTKWVRTHLAHLGLGDAFEPHIYSGREHVSRGKPAPDLYLHAARELEVEIGRAAIIEDSKVGATGALASGATVIGLAAGRHCFDGHADMLRAVGVTDVVHSFDEVARLVGLDQTSR